MTRWLVLLGWAQLVWGVSLRQDTGERTLYLIENPHFQLTIDAAAGGRIRSWKLQPAGRELIALWKGGGEIGGALDDRAVFTTALMDSAIVQPGPNQAVLRLETVHPSGFELVKILTVTDEPVLRVNYEFRNGTQAPQRVMIRNFFLPGGGPQGEHHRYSVNGPEGKRVTDDPRATGYFPVGQPAWAALRDQVTGDGIVALAPGAPQFYLWRGSREFPTFEWLYPELPAGQALACEVRLRTVTGQTSVDWG
ncbi:MAG: hypothetical protein HUU35_03945, partial [Armatimonadetes bacterium]|nr:hypothetical protein [Armatimonadota bacterium]